MTKIIVSDKYAYKHIKLRTTGQQLFIEYRYLNKFRSTNVIDSYTGYRSVYS